MKQHRTEYMCIGTHATRCITEVYSERLLFVQTKALLAAPSAVSQTTAAVLTHTPCALLNFHISLSNANL